MAASEEKSESSASPKGGGASPSGGLVLILTGVNLLATLVMVAVLFISFQNGKNKPSIEDIAEHSSSASATGGETGHGAHAPASSGGGHGEASGAATKTTTDFGRMLNLDQLVVNLSTPGSVNPKFVRVTVSLEIPNEDTENEVKTKMPQVQNAIIDLFNSKKPADLASADGRDYIKDEIKNALNSFLINGKVKAVYFTNFALSS